MQYLDHCLSEEGPFSHAVAAEHTTSAARKSKEAHVRPEDSFRNQDKSVKETEHDQMDESCREEERP